MENYYHPSHKPIKYGQHLVGRFAFWCDNAFVQIYKVNGGKRGEETVGLRLPESRSHLASVSLETLVLAIKNGEYESESSSSEDDSDRIAHLELGVKRLEREVAALKDLLRERDILLESEEDDED